MKKEITYYLFTIMLFFSLLSANVPVSAYPLNEIEMFSGKTMGTTYHIRVVMPLQKDRGVHSIHHIQAKNNLKKGIETQLKAVNQSMSVYSPSSEISIFNQAEKNQPIKISSDFYVVMCTGQNLYKITNGAWDGTLKPLVDLWGFGTEHQISTLPPRSTIEKCLKKTGFKHITILDNPPALEKAFSDITIDLGSIAKGFGVDSIAELLRKNGYSNFLVEIGGEVFAGGEKSTAAPWMVGISKPDKGGNPNAVYTAFPLSNQALATSGDYRNFITIEGRTYSHIINPVNGYPVANGVVSTSVVASNCTFADGLATALMVMGAEKGVKLVNSIKETECLIVVRSDDGTLTDYFSRDFPKSF